MATGSSEAQRRILEERKGCIEPIAVSLKRNEHVSQELWDRLRDFLEYLDTSVTMTPKLKKDTEVHNVLRAVFDDRYAFPQQYKIKAKAIYDRWADMHWGGPAIVAGEVRSIGTHGRVRLPPVDHPIFGQGGEYWGVIWKAQSDGGHGQIHDPNAKCDANVHGHNGQTPGNWYGNQMVAFVRGAHGHHQHGIHGQQWTGAYSVVISDTYKDRDKDTGDVVWYSSPKDETSSTYGDRILRASINSGQPIRILRSANKDNSCAPLVGVRYDGLYRATKEQQGSDKAGRKYPMFKLVRIKDVNVQPALDTLSSPTTAQISIHTAAQQGYPYQV